MIYVLYNTLLSTMLVNREWHQYWEKTSSLRVSFPKGIQRSTYFLSVPWRYGIPAMIMMSVLHWTLSQSVFVMPFQFYNEGGNLEPSWNDVNVGFSVWPIITCE